MNPLLAGPIARVALIGIGLALAGWMGSLLSNKQELDHPTNPFGIKRSPYGEVFAMAMQGPINTDFHVGMYGATPEEMLQLRLENEKKQPKPGSLLIVEPDPEESCDAGCCPHLPGPCKRHKGLPPTLLGKMQYLIDKMRTGHARRTNPLPASQALKFHIRRNAEDKLRLAYELDPSHYANYNSLHFFLTEGIGTRPELGESVDELARNTIEYCLSLEQDPRPALTAAAACTNLLQLMFHQILQGGEPSTPEEMRAVLAQLDECIASFHRIATQWDQSGQWQRLSPQRVDECATRIQFITNIRNACEKTIERIQNETQISS